MSSLDSAIAHAESQLRFIPTRALRHARLISLLNEQTGSRFSFAQKLDDLGRLLGGVGWPLTPHRLGVIGKLSPILNVLALSSELHDYFWDSEPRMAYVVPDAELHRSLLFEFICRPLDEIHIATVPFAPNPDGTRALVMMTRGQADRPYSPRDLRALEKIGAHFEAEWRDVPVGDFFQPRASRAAEHLIALDAALEVVSMPLFAQALVAVFYGSLPKNGGSRPSLPEGLLGDIREQLQSAFRSFVPPPGNDFHSAFFRAYRGRVLCVNIQSASGGGFTLTIHEDASRHARLRRVKAACWEELARDRHAVFSAALALLDDERDPAVLARRAGIALLKPSSVQRILNQARRIVERC